MNLELRKASVSDVEKLRELSIKTFTETFEEQNTEEDLANYIKDAYDIKKLSAELENPASDFIFLYADDNLVGYLKINEAAAQTEINDDEALEVERIYVLRSSQGIGAGRLLMDEAIKVAKERRKKYLWLGVWEHNEKALEFYKKKGYYKIGQHSFFMGEDEQIDYIMRKDL